jgi:hypothetical protein
MLHLPPELSPLAGRPAPLRVTFRETTTYFAQPAVGDSPGVAQLPPPSC